jgi:purine-nucleoside phosphorylase
MIKVKNSELTEEVISILNELITIKMNAISAYKLSRILKDLSSIVEDKVKVEKLILDKYVEKDENGNLVHPKDENNELITESVMIKNVQEYTKEMNELLEIENLIHHDKLKFEDLGIETISVSDIMKIDFLFD